MLLIYWCKTVEYQVHLLNKNSFNSLLLNYLSISGLCGVMGENMSFCKFSFFWEYMPDIPWKLKKWNFHQFLLPLFQIYGTYSLLFPDIQGFWFAQIAIYGPNMWSQILSIYSNFAKFWPNFDPPKNIYMAIYSNNMVRF